MIKRDFHIHTSFCDGINTPEEMVNKAISLGLNEIGLVCHAYTPFDESYCIKRENMPEFIKTISNLKEKYKNKIKIYSGVEFDYYADMDVADFDFVIGAVHYVKKNGNYISVDESKQDFMMAIDKYYGGDVYEFCYDYYNTLGNIYSKVSPDFIAHFDLVTKFNEQSDLFDEFDDRYVKAWQTCANKLLENNAVFEVNVGGITRGYKTNPYPSKSQIDYIFNKGGKFILNSDAHSIETIGFEFDKFAKHLTCFED